MYHGILPNQRNAKLSEGRNVHEFTKKTRGHKEYVLDGMKFDRIEKHRGQLYVYEVKNSTKGYPAARMQMLFYLYKLSLKGISAIGVLEVPRKKKRYYIKLDDNTKSELIDFLNNMVVILQTPVPPGVEGRYCRYCGYKMLCYS